jgi:hypothetical protein
VTDASDFGIDRGRRPDFLFAPFYALRASRTVRAELNYNAPAPKTALHSSTDFPKIDTEASQRDLVFLAKGLILGDVSKIFDEPLLERRDRLR